MLRLTSTHACSSAHHLSPFLQPVHRRSFVHEHPSPAALGKATHRIDHERRGACMLPTPWGWAPQAGSACQWLLSRSPFGRSIAPLAPPAHRHLEALADRASGAGLHRASHPANAGRVRHHSLPTRGATPGATSKLRDCHFEESRSAAAEHRSRRCRKTLRLLLQPLRLGLWISAALQCRSPGMPQRRAALASLLPVRSQVWSGMGSCVTNLSTW